MVCNRCKIDKPEEDFGQNKYSKSGFNHTCKLCLKKARNLPDKLAKRKAYDKKYAAVKAKEYRKTEAYKKNRAQYVANSPVYYEHMLIGVNKRSALKRTTADGTITKDTRTKLFEMQNEKCYYCDKLLDRNIRGSVHLDHFIPISKGGVHSITNVVWACKECNLAKGDTLPSASTPSIDYSLLLVEYNF